MNTVVYIDDEAMLCTLMKRLLSELDAEVLTFTDPEEALAYINASPPSLVICDYRMPKMTGVKLFERLEVTVPFALISGDLTIGDVEKAGIVELLAKPIRPEDLVAFVKRFI